MDRQPNLRVDADPKFKRLGARVQVIQDRIAISEENRARLVEAIETALRFGKGKINVVPVAENARRSTPNVQRPTNHGSRITNHELPFSIGWHCAHCDLDIRPPTPGLFSFNNPLGACPECRGFGRTIAIDLNKAIPNRRLSIKQGVVRVFRGVEFGESQKDLLRACAREEIDIKIPFEELPKADQDFVIEGERRSGSYTEEDYENDRWYGVRGFFRWLESKTYKMHVRVLLSRYRAYVTCPGCSGGRYQPEALNYKVQSGASVPVAHPADRKPEAFATLNVPEFQALSILDARNFLTAIEIPANDSTARMLGDEICARLNYLCEVGVGYLTLDRSTRTLSGGEVQRVNLTTCLGASLVNTLFVMDEPSIGLHPRDVGRLVRVMHNLRDKGNTLLVVEHEEQIIHAADNLLDIGPGRGEHGGELVWSGTLNNFLGSARIRVPVKAFCLLELSENSRTLLMRRETIPTTTKFVAAECNDQHAASVRSPIPDARLSHERKINSCPKVAEKMVLIDQGQWRATAQPEEHRRRPSAWSFHMCHRGFWVWKIHADPRRALPESGGREGRVVRSPACARYGLPGEPGACKSVTGAHRIRDVIMVDQAPLARTPRSTPLLYLGLYDRVRELFAAQPEAMSQGLTPGTFSFNSGSGRCERCSGTGYEKIEMQFLSDLFVRCAECEGKRFQPHVLKVQLHGKSIHDLLKLTVSEAIEFFAQIGEDKTVSEPLRVLEEVGLGYLRLGQPLNTLSGGESQRLKLVGHLAEIENVEPSTPNGERQNGKTGGNLFIFDEPTTGLHFDDVAMLLRLFQRLVDRGHSIVVIEHNLEVIKCADWIVDLGPEAGDAGGEVVATGTPEQIAKVEGSHTGKFLRRVISSGAKRSREIPWRNRDGSSARIPRLRSEWRDGIGARR